MYEGIFACWRRMTGAERRHKENAMSKAQCYFAESVVRHGRETFRFCRTAVGLEGMQLT